MQQSLKNNFVGRIFALWWSTTIESAQLNLYIVFIVTNLSNWNTQMSKEIEIEFRTLIPCYGVHTIEAKNKKEALRLAKEMLAEQKFNTIFNLEAGGEDLVGGIYVSCNDDDMPFDVHIKK